MQDFTPVNRPVAAAGAYYTRLAPWYDLLAASEKKFIHLGLDLLELNPEDKVLEIGSGTGYAQILIRNQIVGGISIGLDLSEGMSQAARQRIEKAGLLQGGLVCSDTLPIPFSSGSIDAIFSSFTLELFDTPLISVVLAECRRVLKPGGRLVFVSLSKDQPLPLMGRLYETVHNRFPTLADCRPIPVRGLLAEAGYNIRQVREEKMWGLPVGIVQAVVSG